MPFSNENLAELEKELADRHSVYAQYIKALIVRMKAAEKAITMARAVILNGADEAMHEPLLKAYAEAMAEWRKECGE